MLLITRDPILALTIVIVSGLALGADIVTKSLGIVLSGNETTVVVIAIIIVSFYLAFRIALRR